MTRNIKYIVIHCTATEPHAKVSSILNYWKNVRKWKYKGYHFLIEHTGKINYIQNINIPSNGVKGYNKHSIHISYIGGKTHKGTYEDTRTNQQKQSIKTLIKLLKDLYPNAEILGHRDFPNVKKLCPCFDVKNESFD